jgi:cytochrome c2
MHRTNTLFIVALLVAVFAACAPTPSEGNVERGAQIFTQGVNESPPCSTCHFVVSGQTGFTLGPNLAGIAERAAVTVEGLSAEEYLHQSIVEPLSHVVPGYRDLMYADYAAHMSEADVQDLIAYLLTLEG